MISQKFQFFIIEMQKDTKKVFHKYSHMQYCLQFIINIYNPMTKEKKIKRGKKGKSLKGKMKK